MKQSKEIQKISEVLNELKIWDKVADALGKTINHPDIDFFHDIEEYIIEGMEEAAAPYMCCWCDEEEVESYNDPCSRSCRDNYYDDNFREKI